MLKKGKSLCCRYDSGVVNMNSGVVNAILEIGQKCSRSARIHVHAWPEFVFTLCQNERSRLARICNYRRMRSRQGSPKGITATAHKLARLVYSMFKHGSQSVDEGQDYYERKYRDRVMKNLKQKAMEMGFALVPAEAAS